jgi:hypothetical protein
MTNTESAEELGLGTRFDEVRQLLLQQRYADRLGKPLEYWVLPSDRRLPLALLGRSVGELLSSSFDELAATPGIGEKKIHSLVQLLYRATNDDPPAPAATTGGANRMGGSSSAVEDTGRFDPSIVSEALWAEWRQTVRRFGIDDFRLGRLAPSLQRLPTVIWHKPLRDYLDHTVAEIRSLRTHGEKRVRCVLEVFHAVYHQLSRADEGTDLGRLLMPAPIREVQDWVTAQLSATEIPSEEEIRDRFARPLLGLIRTDCGPTVARLVEERLGVDAEPHSVREQARQMGVTRARVYQLLDDCGKVMAVRWPEGKALLDRLTGHYSSMEQGQSALRLFFGICELCFPEKQLGSSSADAHTRRASATPEPAASGRVTEDRVAP